ncbi:hypothetical protein LPTSP3_g02470 [Leptospira kobayashii]|uniref:Tetratricopeptide repeat protein n=1 Tax=Leptospira kobayashii TaxID=1917830 RepID=A0ABN6K8N6_9LEPT|nr:tetratricopeptide repeat protein [Leptospira kobayashii]BDA77317.1 hypothetical protein LPTSP3_g02470 [Leptospira kobayashii]
MNKYNIVRILLVVGLLSVIAFYIIFYDFLKEATIVTISILFGFIVNEIVYNTNKQRYQKSKEALFRLFPKPFIPKNYYIENHKAIIRIKKYFKTVKAKEIKGKFREALHNLHLGLKTISEPILLESLSMLLYSNGEIHKAIKNLKSMKTTDTKSEKNKYNLLSVCYNKIGDYHRSIQCLTKVSELLQAVDIRERVRNLADKAECYYNLDERSEASPNIREAYRIAKKNNYTEGKLYVHRILLNYYQKQNAITEIAKILTSTYALLTNENIDKFDDYGLISANAIFDFERTLVLDLLTDDKIRQSILDQEFSNDVLEDLKNFFINREENSKQIQEAITNNLKSTALKNLDKLNLLSA